MSDDTASDPITSSEASERLNYEVGILLGADDLRGEQTYHRGRLARVVCLLHGTGTIAGLRVDVSDSAQGPELIVRAGAAVDPLGRLIEVPGDMCIQLGAWLARHSADGSLSQAVRNVPSPADPNQTVAIAVADIFLRFLARPRGFTPAFASGAFDSVDASRPARIRDCFELKLLPRTTDVVPPGPPAFPDPSISDPAARKVQLQDAIFAAWEDAERLEQRLANPRFPPLEQDIFSVFLARVRVPLTVGESTQFDTARAIDVDNRSRPFALGAAALARWVGAL